MPLHLKHRLIKLERNAAITEADCSTLIIMSCMTDGRKANADLAALKEAGFLRGAGVRAFKISASGEIDGLTDREEQFLAGRRRG